MQFLGKQKALLRATGKIALDEKNENQRDYERLRVAEHGWVAVDLKSFHVFLLADKMSSNISQ